MALLDFKNWKVDKVEGDTATLKHSQGHTMLIALKALPSIQREQIKRFTKNFDEGGPVLDPEKVKLFKQGFSGKPAPTPAPAPTQNYEDGTPDGPVETLTPTVDRPFTEEDRKEAYSSPEAAIKAEPSAPTVVIHNHNAAPAPLGNTVNSAATAQPQAEDTDTGAPLNNPSGSPKLSTDQTVNAPAALEQGQQGIAEENATNAQIAKNNIPHLQENIDTQRAAAGRVQQAVTDLKGHADDLRDYINSNPIDPTHFGRTRTDEQKSQIALGLFLGGLGGNGQTGLDFLNKQISNDIESQKSNTENQKSIFNAYDHIFGDQEVASKMAMVAANDRLAHQSAIEAAKLGTPMADARNNQLQSELAFKRNQDLLEAAGRRGTLDTGEGATGNPNTGQPGGIYEATTPEIGGSSHLLHPNADAWIKRNGYLKTGPVAQQMPKILEQYGAVKQAERGMNIIDEVFPSLTKEANYGEYLTKHGSNLFGSLKGNAAGVAEGLGLAGAGKGLGKGIAAIAPELGVGAAGLAGTAYAALGGKEGISNAINKTRQYDADKAILTKALGIALAKANVSPTEIEQIVNDNTPEWGDNAETLAKKAHNIKQTLRNAPDRSLLTLHGLSD